MKKSLLSILLVGIFAFPCLAIEAKTGGGGSSGSGISNVVEDTTPELGGALEGGNFGFNTSSDVTANSIKVTGTSGSSISTTNDQLIISAGGGVFQLNTTSAQLNGMQISTNLASGGGSGDSVLATSPTYTSPQVFLSSLSLAVQQSSITLFTNGARIFQGSDGTIYTDRRWNFQGGTFSTGVIRGGNFYSQTGAAGTPDFTSLGDPDTGMYLAQTDRIQLQTGGAAGIKIDASQNVGINTLITSSRLDVFNGSATIRGTSAGLAITQDAGQKLEALLVVSTGTTRVLEVNSGSVTVRGSFFQDQPPADYVFKPGYSLLPIEAVESHIKQYGHLPTYSSGADISGGKVSSGEFNRQTQETVENMALYIIELKKEIELLKRK